MTPQIKSLNIGKTKELIWNNEIVRTGIFKHPVEGKRKVSLTQIEGDQQADLKNHGGETKAVYSYDLSFYDYWNNLLERNPLNPGMFGENLTTINLADESVNVGDIFKVGTAIVQALHPRLPCWKLNLRFSDKTFLKKFHTAQNFGIYFKVIEPGEIENNLPIDLIEKSKDNFTIQDLTNCFTSKERNANTVAQILKNTILPDNFKSAFTK